MESVEGLDLPITLTTRQAHFAESTGTASRFVRKVTLLSGFAEPSHEGYESLAALTGSSGTTTVFLDSPYEARQGWTWVAGAPLSQMVCEKIIAANGHHHSIVELGAPGSSEMLELTSLTKRPLRPAHA